MTPPTTKSNTPELDFEVTVAEGKYTYQFFKDGTNRALRYGEMWRNDTQGDNLLYSLAVELRHSIRREVLEKCVEALRQIYDDGWTGETLTAVDKAIADAQQELERTKA